ncbi:MAG: protein translocase subunit SecD [Candidatus Binatia bacterium]|nr:MAG: protein translocase subunit SecD [Candidatus Binatia bacterium]
MKASLWYRIVGVLALLLVALVYLLPSLTTDLPDWWKRFLPSNKIRLGLDLQGGTHLVLTVDVDKALETTLERAADELKREAQEKGLALAEVQRVDKSIRVKIESPEARSNFEAFLRDNFPNLAVADSQTSDGVALVNLRLATTEERRLREFTVEQALETIRNRIDQFGVTEPIIQRQGSQDIVVQLPGIQDPQRAKALIGKTALLEFKLLAEVPDAEAYLSGQKPLPPGLEILSGYGGERVGRRVERTKYLVESKVLLTGDAIADAQVRPGSQLEGPYVALELTPRGAKQFEEITAANVKRRLAIILDNTVYSAPVIQERIPGGRASITGDFDIKEARDLAIVLRAGALPAPVYIAEERTVGPTLGRDSIRQGFISFVVGGTLVVLFMLVYYKFAGLLADLALVLNILFLLAALSALQATLTLPGIAGIVLTLGMAVDANVLINERIREELRLGRSARAAIEAGYERALPAILDSNITTFLSGLILFQFGAGPIKGFAVTLCLGIVTSVFTAVVGTRVVYDWLLTYRRLERVSI